MRTREQSIRHFENSMDMLRAVLNGGVYVDVAKTFGVSRSTVEQRIKTLARRLLTQGAVPGVGPQVVPFVNRLRQHRHALLRALDEMATVPDVQVDVITPQMIDERRIQQAVQSIRYRSAHPDRDVALFYLILATGVLPLEVARLRVRDYLTEEGAVRSQSAFRAETPTGTHERVAYFTNEALNSAMAAYLATRRRRGHGVGGATAYRGLDPDSALFLDSQGAAFRVSLRAQGHRSHWRCPAIHQVFKTLFIHADWKGMSAGDVRHWLLNRLISLGATTDQITQVMGVRHRKAWARFATAPRSVEAIAGRVV